MPTLGRFRESRHTRHNDEGVTNALIPTAGFPGKNNFYHTKK